MTSFEAERSAHGRAVTAGPGHHFFGYYDKHQWDPTNRYLLAMRAPFQSRAVRPDDVLEIGMIDLEDGDRWNRLAETRAWCWQQGCMLQWRPASDKEIVFNDRIGDRFVAVVLDVAAGRRRTLPRPIYTVSNDGRRGLSLNFSRNAITRPGYGYVGLPDRWADDPHPDDDGIWKMDLETGNHELIVSMDQIARRRAEPSMSDGAHWFNHLLFSPDDSRFVFLHRWRRQASHFGTRMFTARAGGGEICRTAIERASHFTWGDSNHILSWDEHPSTDRPGYYLAEDRSDRSELIGAGVLTSDGHMTASPDGRWLVSDEYPDENGDRPLFLYELAEDRRIEVGRFHSPTPDLPELRCDLHPRWNRDGTQVCIDSIHEGTRQMYVFDVAGIVG